MRNKILIIIGILLIATSIISVFVFENNIKVNSETFGFDVLVAKRTIPAGTVIKDENQAASLFTARRITQSEAVAGAIKVNAVNTEPQNLIDRIAGIFVPKQSKQISPQDLRGLVGKKVVTTIFENQQVSNYALVNEPVEFKENERLFAIKTGYLESVGAEVSKDDYVDVWIYYGQGPKAGTSEKVIGPLKVVKLKDANNVEITKDQKLIPQVVIFKLTEDQIALLSKKQYEGTLFLTKYGTIMDDFLLSKMKAATASQNQTNQPGQPNNTGSQPANTPQQAR